MNDRRMRRARRSNTSRLAFGLVLLALGALMLSDNLGFDLPVRLWELWPLVVVGLGAIKLLWPTDADDRQGGFWILTGGLYCWISSWRLFGLHWGSAWPIFLIAIGVQMVLESAAEKRASERIDDAS
jgi:hypothetical protein